MRILVFFDLPTGTKKQRKAAAKFRSFLIKNGFDMLQWSVYMRICKGRECIETYMRRVKQNVPKKGSVRVLPVPNSFYERMEIVVGEKTEVEKIGKQGILDL
ncbi:CRISPR-associated endonuclease Cas2 [Sulfuricurvum sp. IAE1]|uniref:CRISPR-associated endonuclease Cas2 n=1 Tax=Sulfuricurvum sp. IAE1 TaxID=2546102 RepID=UPI00104AFE51|nr:CRISPR-associated endonuclease Cas2 [Sulfuricurvum sp. IAE1]TDA63618.1 CRISPR-associated endonuclease Cas2 [Sulfuricurvum sp. IAE1]